RSVSAESTLPFTRRVEPKATRIEWSRPNSDGARRKNSSSFGLAPGQPASMKSTPSQSSCSAMRSLSSTVSEMPSSWLPSRSVVSKISTDRGTSGVDKFQPVLVLVDLTPVGGEEDLLDAAGDGPGSAAFAVG